MPSDSEYPNWRQNLAVLWFTQFCSSGAFAIALPFCSYFMRELAPGASEKQIRFYAALSAMLPLLSYTVCAPLWGWVADRFGRKKMILRAAFGGGMTLLLMGFAQNVAQFLALRVIQGFLTGTVTATLTLISGTTPPERQGFAMGTISSAVFAGEMSGLFMGGLLADRFGYRNSFRVAAMMLIVASALILVLVHEKRRVQARLAAGERPSWLSVLLPSLPALILVTCSGLAQQFDGSQAALYIELLNGGSGVRGKELCNSLVMGAGALGAIVAGFTISRLIDRHPAGVAKSSGCLCAAAMLSMALLPWMLPETPRVALGWMGSPEASARLGALSLVPLRFLKSFFAGAMTPVCNAWISKVTVPSHRGVMFGLALAFRSGGGALAHLVAGTVASGIGLRAVYFIGPAFFLFFACVVLLCERRLAARIAEVHRMERAEAA
jgi:DHA1 family multidrug resistance protein-like MFS transporter